MPFLPPKQQKKVGHRLWGYLLVCGAIGFYIAGAPLWLAGATALVGVAIMLVRPQTRVEDAQEASAPPPSHAPLGQPNARPIEPAPLIPLGAVLTVLVALGIAAWAIHESSRAYTTVTRVVPWTLATATAVAPEPLAAGDVVLVYRWQRARAAGQFSLLRPDSGAAAPRLVRIVVGEGDSLVAAPGAAAPSEPALVTDAPPDSSGTLHVLFVDRRDLLGVGVGVVWPLDRRRSMP